MPKDLFSGHSKDYAKYRPGYPKSLFDYILQFVDKKDKAWDCATGNGQAAVVLADHFNKVEATDI
ncbi:MAG: class I SAM-dependent methyltransferase, partial [Flavisolibacter sp.]